MAAIFLMTFSNVLNENINISIKISLKFVPNDPINNIAASVQIMAWCRPGDKPLSEPMMTYSTDAYMRHLASMSYIMPYHTNISKRI